MIEWKDAYSIGIPMLDEQHQKLFQFSNDLESIIQDGEVSENLMWESIQYLENYANMHFGKEEMCMFKYQCPIAEKNQEAHTRFIAFYNFLSERMKKEGITHRMAREFHWFIEQWLIEHICKIDVHLKDCVSR